MKLPRPLNLRDGMSPGSVAVLVNEWARDVRASLAALSDVAPGAAQSESETLWAWNERDLTQFEDPISNIAGTATMSVARSTAGIPSIKLALAAFNGTIVWRIRTKLPKRYVIEYNLLVDSGVGFGSTERFGVFLLGDSDPYATANGILAGSNVTTGTWSLVVLQNNTTTTTLAGGGSSASAFTSIGGLLASVQIAAEEQPASATPELRAFLTSRGPTSGAVFSAMTAGAIGTGAWDASWDGAAMDRAGLMLHFTGAVMTGNAYIRDLRIAKHPMDR